MTPQEKAIQVAREGRYDAVKAMQILSETNPVMFLQLAKETELNFTIGVYGTIKESDIQKETLTLMKLHLRKGNLVEAIKLIRGETGKGFKRSKDFVDLYKEKWYVRPN